MSEQVNSGKLFSTGEVATRLNIRRYQLLYLLENGKVPEAGNRISGRRAFTEAEVQAIEERVKASSLPQVDVEIIV
jgi:DNA-binding transcriptional MerR regulator